MPVSPPESVKPSTAKSKTGTAKSGSRPPTGFAAMDKGKLISSVVNVFNSYNPNVDSIDTHVEKMIGAVSGTKFESLDSQTQSEKLFIQQTVYGLIKEKKMIDAFIENLYAGGCPSRYL